MPSGPFSQNPPALAFEIPAVGFNCYRVPIRKIEKQAEELVIGCEEGLYDLIDWEALGGKDQFIEAAVDDLYARPGHPYTRGLLGALPVLGAASRGESQRLNEIPGIVPALTSLPPGCRFAPRYPLATARCEESYPPFEEKVPGHWAACWESERLGERWMD